MYPVFANIVDPDQLYNLEKGVKKPTDLDVHCLSLNMWIYSNNQDQVI